MRISPERFMRASARAIVALATASLIVLLGIALAVAPTAPVEALSIDGQSWIPGETAPDSGDRDLPGASPADGDRDGGDDVAVVREAVARKVARERSGSAHARRRGIRLALGVDPRGPPAN